MFKFIPRSRLNVFRINHKSKIRGKCLRTETGKIFSRNNECPNVRRTLIIEKLSKTTSFQLCLFFVKKVETNYKERIMRFCVNFICVYNIVR